ncbi:MAG: S8 family serine peptidase [Planctomycetota bacterium]
MVRRLQKNTCALVCVLLAAAALAILFIRHLSPTIRGSTPQGSTQLAAVSAARHSGGCFWGGALNSAQSDGTGFFDRKQARSFIAGVAPEFRKYVVDLNARAFLPLPEAPDLAEVLSADKAQNTVYLQFVDHPQAEGRAQLKAAGVELLSYMAGYAWSARGTAAAFKEALKLPWVRAVARVDPRDKLHEQVFRVAAGVSEIPPYARTGPGQARLALIAQPGTLPAVLAAQLASTPALAGLEARAVRPSVLGPRFHIAAGVALAPRIAQLEAAAFLEFVPPPAASRDATTDLESNINSVRGNVLPLLNGSGVTVAVREVGAISPHVDFVGRLTVIDANGATDSISVDHATAVTGQIGSSGVNQPSAKGVAPAVSLLGYEFYNDLDQFATTNVIDAASRGARISNHSYGPANPTVFGDYESTSADWDSALSSSNLVGAFAAMEGQPGNLYKTTDFFVGAKNTICVGATSSSARAGDPTANPPIPPTDGIANFTDFGPMNDGRIKPDLVAFGDNVTLDQGTNATQSNTGTSFSTPAVTGVAALVFQAYKAIKNAEPSAQLTKALLCNTATDLGPPGPDAQYGFGLVNAQAAVNTVGLLASGVSPFYENTIPNGAVLSFSANVQNAPLLRATLCWMDPAGNPAAAKALVNDLDLELVDPSGNIHYPYSLDPNNPSAPATNTGPNSVDPIEQTVVVNPASGSWTIRIKGTNIPNGSQPFAVCLNISTQPLSLAAVIAAVPLSGEVPLPVAFSGRFSTGTITSYDWDFGDGTTGQGQNASHTYTLQGTYTVTLTVTGTDSSSTATKTSTTTTTVTASPLTILAAPSQGPAPLLVSFAPGNIGSNLTCSWSFGDGSTQVQGPTAQHTYQAPGTYTFTLTVTDSQNNQAVAAGTVTVEQGIVPAYPSKVNAKFNFAKGVDELQFVLTEPKLVYTPQQSRDALRDGTFEGNSYTIRLNGTTVQGVNIILNRLASFKSSNASFKLNLVSGQILVTLKAGSPTDVNPLAHILGILNSTPASTLAWTIDVVGSSTIYHTALQLSYKSNGKAGSATKP